MMLRGINLDLATDCCIFSNEIFNAVVYGGWEQCEQSRLTFIDNYDIIELGGGIGYISCSLNKRLTDKIHVVIEPNPLLISIIERSRQLNNCHFVVENKIYEPNNKFKLFDIITPDNNIVGLKNPVSCLIEGINLSTIKTKYNIGNFCLVCDIEGDEFDLLSNGKEVKILEDHCPTILMEFHRKCDLDNLLKPHGFYLLDKCGCSTVVAVFKNERFV